MSEDLIGPSIDRIGAALARIEAAAEALRLRETSLATQHDALKAEAAEALAGIDAILAAAQRRQDDAA